MQDPMAEIESELFGEATDGQKAKRILNQAAVRAASTVADLATNGTSERIRLQASEVILNRVLGPAGKDDQADTLQEFLTSIEKLARQGNRS
jgi:hypothetical protein